eukprot:1876134-Pyramimonas_sp.AAC.1
MPPEGQPRETPRKTSKTTTPMAATAPASSIRPHPRSAHRRALGAVTRRSRLRRPGAARGAAGTRHRLGILPPAPARGTSPASETTKYASIGSG